MLVFCYPADYDFNKTTMGQLLSSLNLRVGDAIVPDLGLDLESEFGSAGGDERNRED